MFMKIMKEFKSFFLWLFGNKPRQLETEKVEEVADTPKTEWRGIYKLTPEEAGRVDRISDALCKMVRSDPPTSVVPALVVSDEKGVLGAEWVSKEELVQHPTAALNTALSKTDMRMIDEFIKGERDFPSDPPVKVSKKKAAKKSPVPKRKPAKARKFKSGDFGRSLKQAEKVGKKKKVAPKKSK